MNKSQKKNKIIILFGACVLSIVAVLWVKKATNVTLNPGKTSTYLNYHSDSTLIDQRHVGYINLTKFLELANQLIDFNSATDFEKIDDNAFFKIKNPSEFYRIPEGEGLYKWVNTPNLPIRVTSEGFYAKVETKNEKEYVYLPYQILLSVAKAVGEPQTNHYQYEGQDTIQENRLTKEQEERNISNNISMKIQTEGIVWQNTTEILTLPGNRQAHASQEEQLKIIWTYVYGRWTYINDPYTAEDTWRSASETIENYYFNGKRYAGDCDDFAILMASFARQLGFDSRVATAYKPGEKSGHAFAQFRDKDSRSGKWYSLDWFGGFKGSTPYERYVHKTYKNL